VIGEGVKVREILQLLRSDGWVVVRQRGSHRQLKHPVKPGVVTVAGSARLDLAPGTLKSIFRQARLER
jgi:predicted RNA binding protein YcfA (HicA-like mRNA interferase family)